MIIRLKLNNPRKTRQIRRWLAAVLVAVAIGVPLAAWLARIAISPQATTKTQKKWEEMGSEELLATSAAQLYFAGKASTMRFIKSTIPLKPTAPGYALHLPKNMIERLSSANFWSFTLYSETGELLLVDQQWPTLQITPKYLVTNEQGDAVIHITNHPRFNSYYTLPLPNKEFVVVWRLYGAPNVIEDLLQPNISALENPAEYPVQRKDTTS